MNSQSQKQSSSAQQTEIKLQLQQLDTKLHELNAREAYVNSREAHAETLELTIADLERRNKALETRKLHLDEQMSTGQEQIATLETTYQTNLNKYKGELDQKRQDLSDADDKIKDRTAKLAEVNKEIAARTQYQRDQERTIAQAVETGNNQLHVLEVDIIHARSEVKQVNTDLRSKREDSAMLAQDLEAARASFQEEVNQHASKMEGLNKQEKELSDTVRDLKATSESETRKIESQRLEQRQIDAEVNGKLNLLSVKERSITAKRDALRAEKTEFEHQKYRESRQNSVYMD